MITSVNNNKTQGFCQKIMRKWESISIAVLKPGNKKIISFSQNWACTAEQLSFIQLKPCWFGINK